MFDSVDKEWDILGMHVNGPLFSSLPSFTNISR